MRTLLLSLLLPGLLAAQVTIDDARNAPSPGTKTRFSLPAYATRAAWDQRARHLRLQILSAAGLLPLPERTPLHPRITGRLPQQGYTVENVLLETLPGFYLGGNLYRPVGKPGPHPAIVSPHGHWGGGRLQHSQDNSVPARAVNLARQGYIVFAQDMLGYNDTKQTPHEFSGEREQLWSFHPLGLQLWNSIRVVDYLTSLPDVDPHRIGVTGASGGGTQTLLLAAVDDRIRASVPVNMVSSFFQGGCTCENAPNLRLNTFNVEFAALMAPRPQLLVAATGDWTRNTPEDEFPAVRHVYNLYGAASSVDTVQIDAPHNYNQASREAMYRFFARVLQPAGPPAPVETPLDLGDLSRLRIFSGTSHPQDAPGYDRLVAQWISSARRQTEQTTSLDALRQRLTLALGAEFPSAIRAFRGEHTLFLSRPDHGDRIPAREHRQRGEWTLVVHQEGARAAFDAPETKQLLAQGYSVLAIDAFQTGGATISRHRAGRHFLTFNQTDDALRVQDILTALAYLREQGARRPRLLGLGDAAIWTLFASAVETRPVQLLALPARFTGSDDEFRKRFFVPGIQRAGGRDAALRLL